MTGDHKLGKARVTSRARAVVIGAGVVAVALGAFFLLRSKADLPIPGFSEPATCPLTGREPRDESLTERPAIAIKVENAPVARPLAGLEKADLVFEELVEGGATRFMAVYHCGDSSKIGPIRSAREVDPAIMVPVTQILAASGSNDPVRRALDEASVVFIEEGDSGEAMRRVPREGLGTEHTLYGASQGLRRIGSKKFSESPPSGIFEHGELQEGARKASSVTINFSSSSTITYDWKGGRWMRSQDGEPFVVESGKQIGVDNILIEEHTINFSKIVDVLGTPSTQIKDVNGSGRALLFRDGRVIRGRWIRESEETPVVFETRSGDPMVLRPGNTWIELVPDQQGEVKGSFSYER
jgi:hypothetical protein